MTSLRPATTAKLAEQVQDDEPEGWEDDILPLSHPSMQQAIARYRAIVAENAERDERIASLAKGHRAFERGR